jgi:putative SOS response-associated peptidase YedK
LWSTWRAPDGGEVTSYTIMTTEPNEMMAEIHNRMPVILDKEGHDRWLDLDADPAEALKPCPSEWLASYPVDKRVGNVRNNDADLIEALRDGD